MIFLLKEVFKVTLKTRLIFFGIVLLSITSATTYAQEVIRGLSVNPELVKISKENKQVRQVKAMAIIDSLSLPFIDDFSTTTIYPDPKLWIDKQAYINSTYPINPVTIGVATLDVLDENGQLYKNASSSPFYADTLTSIPFKLNIIDKTKTDIYFSFFFQPQGLGDKPESGDSLFVEFYSPDSLKWKKVWATPGDSLREFKQVIFQVLPEYKKTGFQFRFRNIASIDASDVAGRHGNVDHWNIDYVRLDTGKIEYNTVIQDIAFVKPMSSLLKTYQSMPWSHYKIAFRTENKPTIDITYKNNGTENPTIGRNFKITELRDDNTGMVNSFTAANAEIKAGETINLQSDLFSPFSPKFPTNLVKFDVESFLSNTLDQRHENDTIHYTQIFSNYFAYDDGSSEAGYGLIGEGAQNAMTAYSFISYQPDTLTGISFYFNPTEHDTTTTVDYAFDLAVWADNNGTPGNLIYSKLITPKKVPLLNEFYNFKLDSGILVNGTFYVGFKQESDNFLNIGFDRNNNNQRFLFINFNGIWTTSTVSGSIMIRPVFGSNTQEGPVLVKKITSSQSFSLYPNPADNQVYINTGNYSSNKPLSVEVYTITGKLVLTSKLQENILNVSGLTNGLYLIKLSGENANFKPIKLLIQR